MVISVKNMIRIVKIYHNGKDRLGLINLLTTPKNGKDKM